MVKLSEEAATQIKKMQMEQANLDLRLRIFVETGGCSGFEYGMSFDSQKSDDEVFEDRGIQFFMDPTSLDYLKVFRSSIQMQKIPADAVVPSTRAGARQ
jgi:iron-sulfur cluster assembly protein/iron-sulfur cluster insertion protein